VDQDDEILRETRDPEGRRVVLLARIWHDKILCTHEEIGVFLEGVLRAVATPDHVEHDARPDRMHCFARNIGPSKWLRVVVSYEEVPALIITAHGYRKDPPQWNPST
jgi:hypothetical protein